MSSGSARPGVVNTAVALRSAKRYSVDLPTALAVDLALHERLTHAEGMEQIRRLFLTTLHAAGPAPGDLLPMP